MIEEKSSEKKIIRTKSDLWIPLLAGLLIPLFYFYYGQMNAYSRFFSEGLQEITLAPIYYQWGMGFILFFAIPLLVWIGILGNKIKDTGLQFGNYRLGLILFVIMLFIIILYAYTASFFVEIQEKYPLYKYIGMESNWIIFKYYFYALFYFFALEFFVRGFMFNAIKNYLGGAGTVIMTSIIAAPMFAGASILEGTLGIVINLLYGVIALKTGSFLYSFILSWFWMLLIDWFIIFGI